MQCTGHREAWSRELINPITILSVEYNKNNGTLGSSDVMITFREYIRKSLKQ
jgi:hypothetical protein